MLTSKDFNIPENKITYLDYGFPIEYLTQTEKSKEKTSTLEWLRLCPMGI